MTSISADTHEIFKISDSKCLLWVLYLFGIVKFSCIKAVQHILRCIVRAKGFCNSKGLVYVGYTLGNTSEN